MSGFVAVVDLAGRPVEEDLMASLTASLAHRGSDAQGTRVLGRVGLGHVLHRTTREAAFETQPLSLDGGTWLVGDVRVDGREDLVRALGEDVSLDETPDAELVLRAWRRWGERALDRMLGDFAFAIWDGAKQQLFCARDRFGTRGLYWARTKHALVVSSSLPCVRAHPEVSDALDERALCDFLLTGEHGWIDRAQTPWADVRLLPAAHRLVLEDGDVAVSPWWRFPEEVPLRRERRERDVVEAFRDVFARAVRDRLRGDAVVLALGGGMDSSTIAATAVELLRAGEGPASFSAVTLVYDRLALPRERPFVEATAERLGLDVEFLVGDDGALLDPPVTGLAPIEIHQPALNLDFLRRVAARGRVHLVGAAGDHVLRGGPALAALPAVGPREWLAQVVRLRTRYGAWPSLGTGLLARLRGGRGAPEEAFPFPTWLDPDLERSLDLRARWAAWWASSLERPNRRHPLIHEALVTPSWCVEDLLRPDGFVEAEVRDPYLDWRVVEFVLALPSLPWLHRKHLLREATRDSLPASVRDRPKTVLGDLHHVLLSEAGAERVDAWEPCEATRRFVVRERVPPLAGGARDPASSYVDLRPRILDLWLRDPW